MNEAVGLGVRARVLFEEDDPKLMMVAGVCEWDERGSCVSFFLGGGIEGRFLTVGSGD